jgi:hypothetical protein
MSPLRRASLAAFFCMAALAVGFHLRLQAQAPEKADKPDKEAKPAAADKPADLPASPGDELVKQALEKLNKLGWLAADIRQEVRLRALTIHANGRYVYATGDRVFYELQTEVAGGKGRFRLICDGKTIWRIMESGAYKAVERFDQAELRDELKKLLQSAEEGNEVEKEVDRQLREEIVAQHGFAGVRAVLDDLHRRMRFKLLEPTDLPGEGKPINVYLLQGEWTPQALESMVPKGNEPGTNKSYRELWEKRESFLNLPRQCRLYLGKANGSDVWPYRVEWLGPLTPGGADEIICALELREPVLSAEPPPDADKIFEIKLTPEEEKLVVKLELAERIKAARNALVMRRQAEQRLRGGGRTLDPMDFGSSRKPELLPPGKPIGKP